MSFTYNGAGKRLSKQDSGGTITYMYDMDRVVLERNAQDTTVARLPHYSWWRYWGQVRANTESNSIDFKECTCQIMTDTIDVRLT